ncbi:MAG: NAD(P)/FAD-dependent oxidoreductase [Methylococcaceae bacterium]|nr:NAD(P)/FAD-dependent oxidoreductase [Methylococcaceae bacterium]
MYPNKQDKKRLVVVGNGMAGIKTVEEVLTAVPDDYEITVFGNEPYGNYNRILLSSVLSGEKAVGDIFTNDRQWYADHGITLYTGDEKTVEIIDRKRRKVIAKDGTVAEYDRLLIATGSKPIIADIPGNKLAGIVSFRDITDVTTMLTYAESHCNAVVLGGGLLGLEAASGLVARGMNVTVVHNKPFLLNRQLDEAAAKMLQSELEKRGIRFTLAVGLKRLISNDSNHISSVLFEDDTEIPCDLFVMAIGVQPNIALAQKAGIYCERGIVVTDTLQTYDPSIYAVGECIQHRGQTFGLVAPLFEQAKVCATHLSGHGVGSYLSLPNATKLKITGINVFSSGNFSGNDTSEHIRFCDPEMGIYKKIVVNNNRIQGIVLYGDIADSAWYQTLFEEKADIARYRQHLVFGLAYAA